MVAFSILSSDTVKYIPSHLVRPRGVVNFDERRSTVRPVSTQNIVVPETKVRRSR